MITIFNRRIANYLTYYSGRSNKLIILTQIDKEFKKIYIYEF